MADVLLDEPASPPMTEVHIWIGHYANGGEGMIAASMPPIDGAPPHFMPLMNSRRAVAEGFEPLARRIQSASQHSNGRITRIELHTFRAVAS